MAAFAVLLTDFGFADPYVGQMKGAFALHAPEARVLDLCHQVEPFNILQAAFFLESSRKHFPEGTVFVAVVDPGVGGDRRIVLLEKHRQFFLAPDNGLLTLVMQHGGGSRVRDVTPAWRREASATFHGRDIFAPLAAKLLTGAPPERLGEEVNPHTLVRLPGLEPVHTDAVVDAMVLHVDRFGNCLLNLECEAYANMILKARDPVLATPVEMPLQPAFTYEKLEPGQVGVLKGSQGYLELAMNKESAASVLGLAPGATVRLRLERHG
ncbi:Adenosyl-chloride synthase [Fundidesulfovibrio magnetotacticus]|uniref:Adenosyl-chloride synthase n=1 Tax=Fundidesulfovibrio magnetotacticus TaxID=2730080 RepID=A0A6V8LME7_9BACT|nr:SAM-dependent chlorinase/fluorinase [Fundidesulfovibrio magnetotacticus]GFK92874.1 Adenosyl-chloride synthase [Fundidesulfovibrio magnetotacticus]